MRLNHHQATKTLSNRKNQTQTERAKQKSTLGEQNRTSIL